MKRHLEVCAVLLMIASLPGCSSRIDPVNLDRKFDAGGVFINRTAQIRHTFQVENDSNSPLNIKEISKSCTCASATISKRRLAPGETADLEMVVNVRPIFNRWNVACRVVTDHPTETVRDYVLSYRTYPHARFDVDTIRLSDNAVAPGSVGEAGTDQGAWLEIYEPANSEPDALIDLQGREAIVATFEREPTVDLIEGGTVRRSRYRVSVALASESQSSSGTHTETITARTERGDTASSIATWSVESPIIVAPSTISFGIVETADGPPLRKVTIRSGDGRPFHLLTVEGQGDQVAVRGVPSDSPSCRHRIDLVFRGGPATERFVAGEVMIATDHPEAPQIQVDWSAILKTAGPPEETPAIPGDVRSVSASFHEGASP